MKELQAAVPAPVDIEELGKIGRHAEVCAGCAVVQSLACCNRQLAQ